MGSGSDLVCLPHGFEGQYPIQLRSLGKVSARLCRRCVVVANMSTPAQYFHALRRQKIKEYAKVVMAPKSLLRHKLCISELKEFTNGSFEEFIQIRHLPKSKHAGFVLRQSLL